MNKCFPHRSLHLVDVENLLANPRPAAPEASLCRSRYEALVGLGPDDLVIVACSHGAAVGVGLSWSGARLVVRSGPDGADIALLNVIQHEGVEARFDRVVIASGDGIFAEGAAQLGRQGVSVTVVSRPESLSQRLRLAASGVVFFSVPAPPAPCALEVAA